ncbi:MAG: hypothetical protein L3J63_03740 [Geopsychrobacter sp.]|nr:hypothetical protein [Geopsychrobacter sp.]
MQRTTLLLIALLLWAGHALAVPETVSLRVTDVTPRSFCLVWMSNVTADPGLEIYADAGMAEDLTDSLKIEVLPDLGATVADAARSKHIFRVRVSGLQAGLKYHVRSLTRDSADSTSIAYSALQAVTTATRVVPYRSEVDGSLGGLSNDMLSFKVYVRPAENGEVFAGVGDLLLLESAQASYPVSAFAGQGIANGEGVLDLNNLFDLSGLSFDSLGNELIGLRVYRGDTLSVLYHLRKLPVDSGRLAVAEPLRGFNRADLNLDGQVDTADFNAFKEQYRLAADDAAFNPDFNFVALSADEIIAADVIDLRDFGWFAGQHGKSE